MDWIYHTHLLNFRVNLIMCVCLMFVYIPRREASALSGYEAQTELRRLYSLMYSRAACVHEFTSGSDLHSHLRFSFTFNSDSQFLKTENHPGCESLSVN